MQRTLPKFIPSLIPAEGFIYKSPAAQEGPACKHKKIYILPLLISQLQRNFP